MKLEKIIEKTIKIAGAISKAGVQLGADIADIVSEKNDDDKEIKRKTLECEDMIGEVSKKTVLEVASKSPDVNNIVVENSVNTLKKRNAVINQNTESIVPLVIYTKNEISKFDDGDFLIMDKSISSSGRVVFDVYIKKGTIGVGSYILISNSSNAYPTRIMSIDSPVSVYKFLDGSIKIISKGIAKCRELYNNAARNEVVSIVVEGIADNYAFIETMNLAKGIILTEEKYNTYISSATKNSANKYNPKDINEFVKKSSSFLQYITSLDEDILRVFLDDFYEKLKNDYNSNPVHLGENGCFEFAGALLLIPYIKIKFGNYASNDCNEAIKYAFLGASAGIFSNLMDKVIYDFKNISYEEWSAVYRYLKENYADLIRSFEFANGYKKEDHIRFSRYVQSLRPM